MTTLIQTLEARITAIFRERDPLMDDFAGNRERIEALEKRASHAQYKLALAVEAMDPKRAARLREMAGSR